VFDVSTMDGAEYFYSAVLKDSSTGVTVATTRLECVSVSLGLRLYDQGQLALSQDTTVRLKWEHPALQRVQAFPGLVAIFNSSKTAERDPEHVNRVARLAYMLTRVGYVQRDITDVFQCILVMKGPQFVFINDISDIEPLKYTDIPLFRILMLPGVTVMSDDEISIVKKFMTVTKHSVVISTDGVAGRYNGVDDSDQSGRLSGLLGVVPGDMSNGGDVVITNNDHPITRFLPKDHVVKTAGALQQEYSAATTAVSLAKRGNTPSMFVLKRKNAQQYPQFSLVMNFDPTQSATDSSYEDLILLWKGVVSWMSEGDQILRIKWELQCDGQAVASANQWLTTIQGETELTVRPNSDCVNKQPKWVGYTYPYDSTDPWNDRVGLYNSFSMSFPGAGNEKLTTAPTAAPGQTPAVSEPPTVTDSHTAKPDKIVSNFSNSLIPSAIVGALLLVLSFLLAW